MEHVEPALPSSGSHDQRESSVSVSPSCNMIHYKQERDPRRTDLASV